MLIRLQNSHKFENYKQFNIFKNKLSKIIKTTNNSFITNKLMYKLNFLDEGDDRRKKKRKLPVMNFRKYILLKSQLSTIYISDINL